MPRPRESLGSRLASLLIPLAAGLAFGTGVMMILAQTGAGDAPPAEVVRDPAALAAELRTRGATLRGPQDAPFTLRHPRSWRPVPAAEPRRADPPATAGIRRRDGSGVVTVTVRGPLAGGVEELRATLPAGLRRRFRDLEALRVRTVRVGTGPALYASWRRGARGRAQSTLVVPGAGDRSYAVDTVAKAGAEATAAEVAAIVGTFDPGPG